MKNEYDFGGWATKNNLRCSDGRVIRKGAFDHLDGKRVPIVWNHRHGEPTNILGHADLEVRKDGVYAYCSFNNTYEGLHAKESVKHGDLNMLSIFANGLKQKGPDVLHGDIKEVSLVIAGANPGAVIDNVILHSDGTKESLDDNECIVLTGETIDLDLSHSDEEDDEILDDDQTELEHSDDKKEETSGDEDNETVGDIFETLTDKQKNAVYSMIGQIVEESEEDDDSVEHADINTNKYEGGETMKHNVFDNEERQNDNILMHADVQNEIITMAKAGNVGSFQLALKTYMEENELQHDALSGGFVQTGNGNVSMLFPEYKDVRPGAPELITNDQGWISVVMQKVHKSPISRIRTSQVDIRNIDALRAKGYGKGKKKSLSGNFNLVRRTTDPQTVYVKNALHRDDIVDIVDFDYVSYLYGIDRLMLNEELAMAIMLGDGREEGDQDKIAQDKIRPIWLDDDLYTLHVDLDIEGAKKELQGTDTGVHFGENYVRAEAMVNTVLYAREKYKGTGTPDMFCTPHDLNVMLLARDMNGRRIYSSKAELASALNVGDIYTAEQFEGKKRTTTDGKTKKLHAMICNLGDYSLGATKGGEVTHFNMFDIDFNQEKSLLETRCSGALTRVYSAIAIEEDTTPAPEA